MLNALLDAWARELGQALEMMTGQSYRVTVTPAEPAAAACLWYSQSFANTELAFAVGAEEHAWNELGTRALQGAGIELIEPAEAKSTWFEIVQQATGGAARAVSRGGDTLEPAAGGPSEEAPAGARFFEAAISAPDGVEVSVWVAVVPPARPQASDATSDQQARTTNAVPHANTGTMEVLLDVHLPISISFGQNQLRLKDVLKLTAGSVVELNRQPEEPVEVIVNDYVIARGEVVILDGNYAVRIQEIVSRQQRLGLRDAGRKQT